MARDLILAAFWEPEGAFWWSGGVLGIHCNIAALAGLPGGGPKRERIRSGGGKPWFLGPPNKLKPILQDYRTTGLQDYRTAGHNMMLHSLVAPGGPADSAVSACA